ncbi:hypothetical protein EV361DRAFT_444002 [Lentinula raphanica]|uniref:F-box domain-containing protein n=1 Tax=Lentinula raphanica TaxID=153919 RepID=A0AA38P245_9AGAR|nr:hypothetical protein F5878DRAFT_335828 [Lentinula raphanica]KAJ3975707.1 hypothetical protein EV361DRAFT_444002 [Lentinula raphanica]
MGEFIRTPTNTSHLLYTNVAPSAHERCIIADLLEKKVQHLRNIEEMARTLNHELIQARTDLAEHKALLSGVRRLPVEIMSEIFLQCLPEVDTSSVIWSPEPSPDQAPLLLTQVCRNWRSIAIGTPRLWSTLSINASNGSASHAEISKLWLDRSKKVPLTLSLLVRSTDRFYGGRRAKSYEEFVPLAATKVLTMFVSHLWRVRALALLFALPVIRAVPELRSVRDNVCVQLERLHLVTSFENTAREISWTRSLVHSAPNLRHLYFDSSMVPLPIVRGQEWFLRLRTINLDAAYGIPPQDFFLLLRNSPELVRCVIVMNLDESLNHATHWDEMPKVMHSALQELSLSSEDIFLGNVLDLLTLPALVSLKLSTVGDEAWPHQQLIGFMSRSLCILKELKLDSERMTDDQLLIYLGLVNKGLRALYLPTWKSASEKVMRFITPVKMKTPRVTLLNSPGIPPFPLDNLPYLETLTFGIAPHQHIESLRDFVKDRCLVEQGKKPRLRSAHIHLLLPIIAGLATDLDLSLKGLLDQVRFDGENMTLKITSSHLQFSSFVSA